MRILFSNDWKEKITPDIHIALRLCGIGFIEIHFRWKYRQAILMLAGVGFYLYLGGSKPRLDLQTIEE